MRARCTAAGSRAPDARAGRDKPGQGRLFSAGYTQQAGGALARMLHVLLERGEGLALGPDCDGALNVCDWDAARCGARQAGTARDTPP